MRVAVTGGTGLIGRAVVAALRERGDTPVVLSRNPDRVRDAEAHRWSDPKAEPAPALAGCDAVVNLLGEPIAQRWTDTAKREIRASRELGTRNLVAGLRAASPRPRVLVSQSGSGYYGPRGSEPVDEAEPPGDDYVAGVVVAWEREADAAADLGMRVVKTRTGLVLSPEGGALAKMLPPFKLGVGGPVAGGRQYVPWIHADDVAGALLACIDDPGLSGPVNVTAPNPATNAELSRALGRALRRPALLPVPALAVRLLYGEMATIVTTGVRAVPAVLEAHRYEFREPDLDRAVERAVRG
jgi:uncharacterized protein (TIGR01777 family)